MSLAVVLVGVGCNVSFSGGAADNIHSGNTISSASSVTQPIQYPNWTTIKPGVDIKQELVDVGVLEEKFTFVRIDPTQQSIVLALDTKKPQTVEEWQQRLHASVVLNAGYFDPAYQPTTRLVLYGESFGPLLSGTTGLFRSQTGTAWEIAPTNEVTSTSPTAPQFSLQSYPLLLQHGQVAYTAGSDEPASRTVVAIDRSGLVYFIITEYGVLSLRQLAATLQKDISIPLQDALNLDGGTSSGMSIHGSTQNTAQNTEQGGVGEAVSYNNSSAVVPSVVYIP